MQWIRGWVSAENIDSELHEMTIFIAQANACAECQRDTNVFTGKCLHQTSYFGKLKELRRTKTLRPLGLLIFCMCVIQSSGNAAIRPFLVQIFETFRIPMDANWGSVFKKHIFLFINLDRIILFVGPYGFR